MPSISDKKRVETWILNSARKAGIPIPLGEVEGEEPDFRFLTEVVPLGIELSEVIRPASSNDGILPVAQESFHKDVIQAARKIYQTPDATPLRVYVGFRNPRGKRQDKQQLASTLATFVKSKVDQAKPFAAFYEFDAPEDFIVVTILDEPGNWSSGESGGVSFADIQPQVADRISAKNKLIGTYRKNLPAGAQIWLLLYCAVAVSRSMPIPAGIESWTFPFEFDRVFWFTCLDGWAEIKCLEA
jgi:hypothetical protein